MKKVVLLLSFCFLYSTAFCQQQALDRLKKEGFEIGVKLAPPAEVTAEETKKSLIVAPDKTISLSALAYRVSCAEDYCAFSLRDGKVTAYNLKQDAATLSSSFSKNPIYNVAFHPTKNIIAFGDKESKVTIFDLDKNEKIKIIYELGKAISDVRFSPDGSQLAVAFLNTGNIALYATSTYEKTSEINAHGAGVYYLAFSPDASLIASASRDRKISITTNGATWPAQVLGGHKFIVLCVDFSPDGNFLASGGGDAQMLVWEKKEGTIGKTPYFNWVHADLVNSVKFYNNYLFTGSKDGKIRIFDFQNKKLLGVFEAAGVVFSLDITRDGKYLVVAGKDILFYNLSAILAKLK